MTQRNQLTGSRSHSKRQSQDLNSDSLSHNTVEYTCGDEGFVNGDYTTPGSYKEMGSSASESENPKQGENFHLLSGILTSIQYSSYY